MYGGFKLKENSMFGSVEFGEEQHAKVKNIDDLTLELHGESKKAFIGLENIKLTLINIKISVAKLNSTEAGVLSTIANHVEEQIDVIEQSTFRSKEIAKEIAMLNKAISNMMATWKGD
jgi:hypothetical protein